MPFTKTGIEVNSDADCLIRVQISGVWGHAETQGMVYALQAGDPPTGSPMAKEFALIVVTWSL